MYFLFSGTEGEDYLLKLILAILGPIIGLGIITCGIFFCLLARKTRAKRPSASKRNKLLIDAEMGPSILHFTSTSPASINYQPHELRATAAGDSTLKVNYLYISFNFLENEYLTVKVFNNLRRKCDNAQF